MAKKDTTVKQVSQGEFVSQEQFKVLETGVGKMMDMLEKVLATPTPTVVSGIPAAKEETLAEKMITKAGPNSAPINPEWEEHANEILGEALDHCEVAYLKSGGLLFTVVIKTELSNASKDYLERHGTDRRSKEIGSDGIAGVDNWCKLVKANLGRPRTFNATN